MTMEKIEKIRLTDDAVIPTQKIDTIWPPCGDDEIVSY